MPKSELRARQELQRVGKGMGEIRPGDLHVPAEKAAEIIKSISSVELCADGVVRQSAAGREIHGSRPSRIIPRQVV